MDTVYESPDDIEVPVTHGVFRSATRSEARETPPASADAKPRGRPYTHERDWRKLGLVAASAAAGALVGAGLALLFAPYSGEHARLALASEFRRHRPWNRSPWDRLGNELARAAERRNKRSTKPPRLTAE